MQPWRVHGSHEEESSFYPPLSARSLKHNWGVNVGLAEGCDISLRAGTAGLASDDDLSFQSEARMGRLWFLLIS